MKIFGIKVPYAPLLVGPWLALGLGFLSNAIVMAFNGAQMPVLLPGGMNIIPDDDLVHCAMTHATHLKFLADWIVINGLGIASPGDFLLWTWELTSLPALIAWITLILKDQN